MLAGTFDRFTDRARRVLVLTQEEARLLGHPFIGTEHILLGLLDEGEGVAAQALSELGITVEAAREKVEEVIGQPRAGGGGSASFTPRAKKVLELALREALQLGHNYIGTEHMLLGLVREGEGVGAQVLVSLGADLARVRQQVIQILAGYHREEEASEGPSVILTRSAVGVRGPAVRAHFIGCQFCGERPPETGRLVAAGDAVICERCITLWHARLNQPDQLHGPSPEPQVVEPIDEGDPEGPDQ